MKTKAAVLWGVGQKWEVEDVDLDGPKEDEVLVKLTASGLCHSDYHLVTGELPAPPYPIVAGHEGAGVIAEVGPGVAGLAEGDHVVMSFLPACGQCAPCARGMSNLCDLGAILPVGGLIDGTCRFHARGQDVNQLLLLGTFSEYTVVPTASVIKLDDNVPLDKAALLGCGVTTGFGSVVRTGEAKAGDTVVVMGIGGVGINSVQAARIAGARNIVAIDPVDYKLTRAKEFGATHVASSVEEALPLVIDLTRGEKANVCVITVGVAHGEHVAQALSLIGKRGRVVQTALAPMAETRCPCSTSRCSKSSCAVHFSVRRTRAATSRRCWRSTKAVSSCSTSWSPRSMRSRTSTRVTTTCSAGRTYADWSVTEFRPRPRVSAAREVRPSRPRGPLRTATLTGSRRR
jgi:NDMA-dependent alcohol dehydrogenase